MPAARSSTIFFQCSTQSITKFEASAITNVCNSQSVFNKVGDNSGTTRLWLFYMLGSGVFKPLDLVPGLP